MAPSVLTLRLFGALDVRMGETAPIGLHRRAGQRLLAYLTLKQGMEIAYSQLAQMFYPAEARGSAWDGGEFPSTRQAIRTLRQTLGEHAWRLVGTRKGYVRLDLEGVDVDIVAFDRAAAQEDVHLWQEAVRLYRAPLLEGWEEPWLQEARRRYQRSFERMTSHLTACIADPHQAQTDFAKPLEMLLEREGGAVPLDSPFYIARPEDVLLRREIERRAGTIRIQGARQVGKTSLLARGLQAAREAGSAVITTDLQMLNDSQFADLESFYQALIAAVAFQLELPQRLEECWNPALGPNMNFDLFVRRRMLPSLSTPLVWSLDEVDRLLTAPFGGEVLGLFRSWHNARVLDPASPLSRLTLVLAYAHEAHQLITDSSQSPFHVGTALCLDDFTPNQCTRLHRRYGSPLSESEAARLFTLLAGHPYLLRRTLDLLVEGSITPSDLTGAGDALLPHFEPHLCYLTSLLERAPELQEAVRNLLLGQNPLSQDLFQRLRAAGILAGNSAHMAHLRCPLYTTYFRSRLL